MIGVFVTFRYRDNFNEQTVRKIAETARAKFEGMAGLRSKALRSSATASGSSLYNLLKQKVRHGPGTHPGSRLR
jgi:hypothetical protein